MAKLTEIKDLACFLTTFLEGNALTFYFEMNESEQLDAKKIEQLKGSFFSSIFEAYGRLRTIPQTGEKVFANEVRQLAGLAEWKGEGLERAVKLAFAIGFPDRISMELKQVKDIEIIWI